MSSLALLPPAFAPPASMTVARTENRTDRRLATGLRRGDPRALEQLHAEYGRTLFGFLRNTLGDRGTAEDVFQQVLTEVWARAEQYDAERGSLLGWIMQIARSRAIDEHRRRRPEPNADAVERLASEPAPGEDPDTLADRWRITHMLGLVDPDDADLLRLRFYDELTQTEIAQLTGLALGTVKGRMVRGLERLRDLIEADDARLASRLGQSPAPLVEVGR